MKLAIFGTRGIPNHHGGFEQFAENFAVFAAKNGIDVTVYNSHLHPYQKSEYQGVNIVSVKDWEDKLGTAGQFFYDLNAILHMRKINFDIILQLGYTSSSIWAKLLPKNAIIVTNMDGLEWKRSKYSKNVQKFLKFAEKWAVNSSDYLISDSIGIQSYLKSKYRVLSKYIAYGAEVFYNDDSETLNEFNLKPQQYYLLIARMEPENNIEMILDGYAMSDSDFPMIIIGNAQATPFGRRMLEKFNNSSNIQFLGAIYDQNKLNNLRFFAHTYFHGHSVGGTNPSLLEAMACNVQVAAHLNPFNQGVLGQNAHYFESSSDVVDIINQNSISNAYISANQNAIKNLYSWDKINQEYLAFLLGIYHKKTERCQEH